MKESNIITIKKLVDGGLNEYINYKNQVVISYIKDLSLFQVPCHLRATTIVVCLNGELEGRVNLNSYKLSKYSVLINFPENIIQITSTKNLKAIAILISADFLHSLSLNVLQIANYYSYEVRKNETFTLPQDEIQTLSHYFSILKRTMLSPATSTNEDLMRHFSATFITNIMLQHHYYHKTHPHEHRGSKGNYIIFDRFAELVKIYHSRERELKFYADKLCVTPKYLSKIVKQISGRKATEWISEYVILEAKSLLRYSGNNVQEVANKLNFPTQSAFGKYFNSHVGMSPTEFMESSLMQ